MKRVRVRATATFSWEYDMSVSAIETDQEAVAMEQSILTNEEPVDYALEKYVNASVSSPHTVTVELVEP